MDRKRGGENGDAGELLFVVVRERERLRLNEIEGGIQRILEVCKQSQ